ncbi:hypothetical protein SRB5_29660 [Streptomyces sp. RB5]|uniref:SsuA/THI5-like domain-containing protein n=1 Tax=Streptomyces smaragdinus TaxID=2585196 RepID=A0A7K0CH70_9ACTN|nr:ABC transporter substrate-binding protein [Streptomyces smaragdinus]MQY12827.1 hypothetical protein [Streptomyces smaragdinus]
MSLITPRRNFLALIGAAALTAGCGTASGSAGGNGRTVSYQGWAGTVTPAELAQDLGHLDGLELDWVGNTISGPQDIQSAAAGDVTFGGAFNGAVVKLAAARAPVTSVISYYGVDKRQFSGYYVLEDGPIRSARDLTGAKVGMNTLGAHAEAMLDIYLKKQGVSQDGVERLALPPVNTEQALRQGQIDVAVLGGILRDKALERGGIRPLFDDYKLLGAFSAGTYVIADRWLERNPDTAKEFVTGVAKALVWSRETSREEVVDRMTGIVRKRDRDEDTDPLKYWHSYGVATPDGRIEAKELQLWIDWLGDRGDVDPRRIRAADLYTNEFNGLVTKNGG